MSLNTLQWLESAFSAFAGNQRIAGILLLWTVLGLAIAALVWPDGRGRRLARQIASLAVLGFREGVRLRLLWTIAVIALIPALLAYFSDADGTHAGRARLILNVSLTCGEILGAALIVLLSALSVAREIESRVMHTLGTKPVPRWAILLGKALGFWAIDLLFLGGLILLSAALIRAVPLRPETRQASTLLPSGKWEDLSRNALTTRNFHGPDGKVKPYAFVDGGKTFSEKFSIGGAENARDAYLLRFVLSTSVWFASSIEDLRIQVGYEGEAPFLDKCVTVAQDRPFELLLPAAETPRAGTLVLALTPKAGGPRVILHQPEGAQLGVKADGFASNMGKAFLLLALQGWILAIVITAWSGVLSFPVAVALGLILILGGEMSRQAVELMQSSAARAQQLGDAGAGSFQNGMTQLLNGVLLLLPDFRAAGGPSAFSEGTVISGRAIAHAAFWIGVARALAWAIPGIWLFQKREVGR